MWGGGQGAETWDPSRGDSQPWGSQQEDGLQQQACFRAEVPVRHWDSLRVTLLLLTLLSPATLFIQGKPFKSHGFWEVERTGGLVWISLKLLYQQMWN